MVKSEHENLRTEEDVGKLSPSCIRKKYYGLRERDALNNGPETTE